MYWSICSFKKNQKNIMTWQLINDKVTWCKTVLCSLVCMYVEAKNLAYLLTIGTKTVLFLAWGPPVVLFDFATWGVLKLVFWMLGIYVIYESQYYFKEHPCQKNSWNQRNQFYEKIFLTWIFSFDTLLASKISSNWLFQEFITRTMNW